MFVLVRTLTYASAFIGFVLIFLPARLLAWSGIVRPAAIEVPQILGVAIGSAGAAVALWCVFAFALIGKGTPAPFDPPRRLVVRGPYRFVRNPMYIGAASALAGAALFFESMPLLVYFSIFLLVTHLFVVIYEEPTLRRSLGPEYEAYCRRVRRWLPRVSVQGPGSCVQGTRKQGIGYREQSSEIRDQRSNRREV
jgi:protein-S-isoprenylcysteine O-methyltransferase Ste14